ncbi:MAG: chromosome segregation protein SMC [Pseudomonadota bacterium]
MQFKRLRLQGFKSFVDPTEMRIETGLTGLVGPNGCGKSNLLEALRWVMGESRAKAMRGEGMDDVIFAGTGTRPARNAAQVALVIDNDRRAPGPFAQQPELEISRRITRDIGSAYAVNGKTVRARDVTMLFADASSGAQSPSLVRQGQIGELIAARPTARRRILEEAAGIAGLYQRRHEAELKLNGAEANLARVQELTEGLEKQIRALDRQAAQAQRYRSLAEALRLAEAVALQRRWVDAEVSAKTARTALAEALAETARTERAGRLASEARAAPEAALAGLREASMVATAIEQRLALAREQIDREAAEAEVRAAALTARVAELTNDRAREEALHLEAIETGTRLTEEAERLRQTHAGHGEREREAEASEHAASQTLTAAEQAYEAAAADAARVEAETRAADQAITRSQTRLDEADRAQTLLRDEATQLAASVEAATEAAATRAGQAAAAADALAVAESETVALSDRLRAAEEADGAARAAIAAATQAEAALASEQAAVRSMLARDASAAGGVADLLTVEPGFEAALAAALGDDLLLPIDPEADRPGWQLGAASPDETPLPAQTTPLADHVSAPPHLAARLASVAIVAQKAGPLLQAGLAPGLRLVSREGDLWRWDGLCRPAGDGSAAAHRLEQRNRLARLTREAEAAGTALDAARAQGTVAKARLAGATTAMAEARRARAQAATADTDTRTRAARAAAELETVTARHRRATEQLAERQAERAQLSDRLAAAAAARAALGDAAQALAERDAAHAALAEARTTTMTARGALESLRADGAARERRLTAIRREARAWEERSAEARTRRTDLNRRLEEARSDAASAADAPDALAAQRAKLADDMAAAGARLAQARTDLAEGEAEFREAEAAERRAERAASDARALASRREAEAEATEALCETAATAVRDALALAPERLAELTGLGPETLPDGAAAEAEAQKLRRQRDALGAVNLRAEEDAKALETERDALEEERADLDAAIAKLRTGVRGLNREGRERLLAAFDAVNARFGELFRHLFGGGEARLILVDSDDPLEAGLEILCQPPGKKLATLSLLSGGEQTLTALSLIFAVFLCNPAPICVLDEVDAPLDDANVVRFCSLLDEMVRQTDTRFLIITHHAITMSRMDRLYGVTMIEQGVSRLVSVDLTRATEMVDG